MSDEPASSASGSQGAVAKAADAVLRLGAEAARSVAEAASGRPQPQRNDETPLASLLRHGSAAAGSLMGIAIDAARGGRRANGGTPSAPASTQPSQRDTPPLGPQLAPGGVARIPLSIDNSGAEPMESLVPKLIGAIHEGVDTVPAFTLHFSPETLSVAPRDFEKLVITLELDADVAQGAWSAVFTLRPDGSDRHELPFQVSAATGATA